MKEHPPWFVLVGGINGAGKSTFAQGRATLSGLIDRHPNDIELINPDLVTKTVLKQNPQLTLSEANLQAAVECEKRVDALLKRADRSFAIETVLSTDKYKGRIERAKRHGFEVLFVYMLLSSADEAVDRVRIRVRNGGHHVPSEKIRKRLPLSLASLPHYFWAATRSLVFFNGKSVQAPVLVAEQLNNMVRFNANPPAEVVQTLLTLRPEWMNAD